MGISYDLRAACYSLELCRSLSREIGKVLDYFFCDVISPFLFFFLCISMIWKLLFLLFLLQILYSLLLCYFFFLLSLHSWDGQYFVFNHSNTILLILNSVGMIGYCIFFNSFSHICKDSFILWINSFVNWLNCSSNDGLISIVIIWALL